MITTTAAIHSDYSHRPHLPSERKREKNLPVNPISESVVNLCARSAQTRPLDTTLSNVFSCPCFALLAASRSLATFCCGVSLGGAFPPILRVEGFEEACGVVGVKRVGSAGGERDIMVVGFGRMGEGERNWGLRLELELELDGKV